MPDEPIINKLLEGVKDQDSRQTAVDTAHLNEATGQGSEEGRTHNESKIDLPKEAAIAAQVTAQMDAKNAASNKKFLDINIEPPRHPQGSAVQPPLFGDIDSKATVQSKATVTYSKEKIDPPTSTTLRTTGGTEASFQKPLDNTTKGNEPPPGLQGVSVTQQTIKQPGVEI